MMSTFTFKIFYLISVLLPTVVRGCGYGGSMHGPGGPRPHLAPMRALKINERAPNVDECNIAASGPCYSPVTPGTSKFEELVAFEGIYVNFPKYGHQDNEAIMTKVSSR